MPASHSVTNWIDLLRAGDADAAQKIWERYFRKLVGVARGKLSHSRPRVLDEEDVALSAFDSFCRRAREGRFPQLHDRNNLWALLVTITTRKAVNLGVYENRARRRDARELSPEGPPDSDTPADLLERLTAPEPSPEFAAQAAEEFQRLLDILGEESLKSVAVWKMEGYTTEEIAAQLSCTPRTVERKLRSIRYLWTGEAP